MYDGRYQICSLFSVALWQGRLNLIYTSENTMVFSVRNSTITTESSCLPSTNYISSYTTSPTNYRRQMYYYQALNSGVATLEFGFKAVNNVKTWHLDDVSVLDLNSTNKEMLLNGNFENGSLIGWQVRCGIVNCGQTTSTVVQSSCHGGSFCYEGRCQNSYDFVQQRFDVIIGHVYALSFWLFTDGHSAQAAYVTIS